MKKRATSGPTTEANSAAGGASPASSQSAAFPSRLPAIPDHELLKRIGGGSYGEVWLARNALGAFRAVKIVHRHSFEHDRPFEREFAGIQKFEPISRSHEGFVDLLQVGRNDADGYFYYVMELADDANGERGAPDSESTLTRPADTTSHPMGKGRSEGCTAQSRLNPDAYAPHTLKQELQQRGRLPLEECIQLGLALTDALRYLHGQGLVHRDIKPSNIIFAGGMPKLADVGLVADVGEARSYVGTEGFIPPEGPGTPQADLYSLGILLYQASTGKSHQDFPEPLADLDAQPDHARWLEFNAVIHKACVADPRARHQNAEAMQAELALLQRGQSVRRRRSAQRRWAVARMLGLTVTAAGLLTAALIILKRSQSGYTPHPEALRLYKDGQWQYSQLTPEAHVKAHTYLTQAIQVDPKFVQPYGELAALYTWLMLPGITNEQTRLQKVREIADKGLAIDPNSAEGHTALSWCRFLERDWRGAEQEIQKAIKNNPNFGIAHDIYCFYLSMQGRIEEAHREGKRAVELRLQTPESRRATAIIASWPFMAERRFDLAITQLQRVLELDPKFSFGLTYLGACYLAQSNFVAAIDTFKTCALQSATDADRVIAVFRELRDAYDTHGEQGYFRKWIELMIAQNSLPEEEWVLSDNVGPNLAGAYARLGEKGKALKELEEHFDESQVWHQIKFIPEYDSLHDEPRFKAMVKRAGLGP